MADIDCFFRSSAKKRTAARALLFTEQQLAKLRPAYCDDSEALLEVASASSAASSVAGRLSAIGQAITPNGGHQAETRLRFSHFCSAFCLAIVRRDAGG